MRNKAVYALYISLCIVCGMSFLGYLYYHDGTYIMPDLRYMVFSDCITAYESMVSCGTPAGTYQYDTMCDDNESAPVYCVYALKTRSYSQAVRLAMKIRDRYDIACDIIHTDGSSGQNMVPWYTLRTPAMTHEDSNDIIRYLSQIERVRYIRTMRDT